MYRGGIRFRSRRGFQLGLAVEESDVVFEDDRFDRSNSGTSPVVELGIGGERLWLGGDIAFRSLDPSEGSLFVPFEDTTGETWISWKARPRLELQISAGRDLVYSITETWAYFVNERAGISLRTSLSSRDRLHFFIEQGQDDYVEVVSGLQPRIDDFDSYGVGFEIQLARVTVDIGWRRTDYDSSLPVFDGRVDVIRTGLRFGRGLEVRP